MARQPERKRDMIKVLFPGLRRSRSRTPDPSTSGTPPPNQTTVPTSLPIRQIQDDQEKYSASLWESALKTLTPDEMKICEQYKGLELNAIASLLSVVKAKQQECEKHQWKFRLFNKEVKFQNVAGNIASYLVKLQGVGDMVASFDSMHAALPWAAVKLLLQTITKAVEQHALLLLGLERIAYLVCRCSIYEELYLPELKAALIGIYGKMLQFIAQAIHTFSQKAAVRSISAWFTVENLKTWFHDLTDLETRSSSEASSSGVVLLSQSQKRLQHLLDGLHEPVSQINHKVSAIYETLEHEKREKILEWISNIPYEKLHYAATLGRTSGTGRWILQNEEFLQWRASNSSSLLWLHGSPGAGKTKLATTVVDDTIADCKHSNGSLVYFYCDRNQSDRRDPKQILSSFVRQLSILVADALPSCVTRLYEDKQAKGFASGSLTIEESANLFNQLIGSQPALTIIIDALDECDPVSRIQLVELLNGEAQQSSSRIKIFISSRPDHDIKDRLRIGLNLEVNALQNSHDITSYVEDQIQNHCPPTWKGLVNQNLREMISQTLIGQSQGMFQWAVLQIRQLFKLSRTKDILDRLGKLPKDLKQAYDEIYSEIKSQEGSAPQIADPRLLVAAVCQDPHFKDTDPVDIDIDFVFKAYQNLLRYDAKLDEFRFAHLSVREYLDSHVANEKKGHALIGRVCLNILMDPVFQAITGYDHRTEDMSKDGEIELETLYEPKTEEEKKFRNFEENEDSIDLEKEDFEAWMQLIEEKGGKQFLRSMLPLIQYSRVHWTVHLKEAGPDELNHIPGTERLLQDFLGDFQQTTIPFECWLKVLKKGHLYHERLWSRGISPYETAQTLEHFKTYEAKSVFAICLFGLEQITSSQWLKWPLHGDLQDPRGSTLFQIIAATNSMQMAHYLFDMNMAGSLNTRSGYWHTALHAATGKGHMRMVELLINNNADLNLSDDELGTPLYAAASEGHTATARLPLDRDADVNACGSKYEFALRVAAFDGSLECISLLLDRGADVNAYGGRYGYALQAAVIRRNLDCVRLLLDRGADVNACGGEYGFALQAAAFNINVDCMRLLLDRGADVNAHPGLFVYALQTAASNSSADCVRLLLDHGADVNACGGRCGYALQAAVYHGNFDYVRLLLDRGADVNACGGEYGYALQAAAYFGGLGYVRLLLDHGADVNAKGGAHGTCLNAARKAPWHSADYKAALIELLLQYGAISEPSEATDDDNSDEEITDEQGQNLSKKETDVANIADDEDLYD